MSAVPVTVAIPVRNGRPELEATLAAVRDQRLERPLELLVCDSGSDDGSADLARSHGAEVIEIAPGDFSHGGTRNLLMERASGAHVAFLSQDAVPADERWLNRLLEGFSLADDVALVYGPYAPRPEASHMVARELRDWFGSFAPDGRPRVDRLGPGDAGLAARELFGARLFFTDANGCVARDAWEAVPFRPVPYAEDHLLALEMLAAGRAKVFMPQAAVVHSHDYSASEWFRRCFDEWRGLREVYGYVEPAGPRRTLRTLRGQLGADRRYLRANDVRGLRLVPLLARSLRHWTLRAAGAALGSRAARLPATARRRCSLERRASFEPSSFAADAPLRDEGASQPVEVLP